MARILRPLAAFLLVFLLVLPKAANANPELEFALSEIRAKLTGVRISAGPDASKLTRSPWGPELYRSTVDGVVLVYVPNKGQGSGVIVSASCHVVTNWHVVEDAKVAAIIFRPESSRTLEGLTKDDIWVARVLKTSQPQDLALLQLERCPASTRFIPLEDPERIEVGQDVFAIGHPEQLYWTYTEGVISQIRPRSRWQADGREFLATLIQTQTPISYGSSGGPLINRSGKLVGVISNTLMGRAGFNFAVSVHEVKAFLAR